MKMGLHFGLASFKGHGVTDTTFYLSISLCHSDIDMGLLSDQDGSLCLASLSVSLSFLSFFFPSFFAFSVWFWTVDLRAEVFFFFTWVIGSWLDDGLKVHDF